MTAQRAYKYRIYPGREQETLFHKTFGCCRFLYNHMLADRMDMYEKTGKMKLADQYDAAAVEGIDMKAMSR